MTGRATSISLLPGSGSSTGTSTTASSTTATSSTVTYPVGISVPTTSTALPSGSFASVAIDVKTVDTAVVVPVSAVHGRSADPARS